MFSVINASAGGAFLTGITGQKMPLSGARLVAGAGAAATAIIRETDGSGRILCSLAAGQGTSDESNVEVVFTTNVHVTLTGADAVILLYQR